MSSQSAVTEGSLAALHWAQCSPLTLLLLCIVSSLEGCQEVAKAARAKEVPLAWTQGAFCATHSVETALTVLSVLRSRRSRCGCSSWCSCGYSRGCRRCCRRSCCGFWGSSRICRSCRSWFHDRITCFCSWSIRRFLLCWRHRFISRTTASSSFSWSFRRSWLSDFCLFERRLCWLWLRSRCSCCSSCPSSRWRCCCWCCSTASGSWS
mmetsp:Transcript_13930/g.31313  ORF Transcript_13930/g.31313 Transcript_13930/m.31313 type:complete len:208 (-) Transcript_13930:510-1133(-)